MAIHPRQIEVIDDATVKMLRSCSGGEKVMRSLSMFAFGRDLVRQAVRDQHPGWTDEQVREEAFERLHGDGS